MTGIPQKRSRSTRPAPPATSLRALPPTLQREIGRWVGESALPAAGRAEFKTMLNLSCPAPRQPVVDRVRRRLWCPGLGPLLPQPMGSPPVPCCAPLALRTERDFAALLTALGARRRHWTGEVELQDGSLLEFRQWRGSGDWQVTLKRPAEVYEEEDFEGKDAIAQLAKRLADLTEAGTIRYLEVTLYLRNPGTGSGPPVKLHLRYNFVPDLGELLLLPPATPADEIALLITSDHDSAPEATVAPQVRELAQDISSPRLLELLSDVAEDAQRPQTAAVLSARAQTLPRTGRRTRYQ